MKVESKIGGHWEIRTGTSYMGRPEWVATHSSACGCPDSAGEYYACKGPLSVSASELEELYVEMAEAEEMVG